MATRGPHVDDNDDDPDTVLLGALSGLCIGTGSKSATTLLPSPLTSITLKFLEAGLKKMTAHLEIVSAAPQLE